MDDWKGNMQDLERENKDCKIQLKTSKFECRLVTSFKDQGQGWYILTDLEEASFDEVIEKYKGRFGCEKMFQDEKSSGFEIEKSKISKYSRFKRLLFCVYVTQGLMMFVGDWINGEAEDIRKKYVLHINMISAYSNLQNAC
jgi:hypothetical protein